LNAVNLLTASLGNNFKVEAMSSILIPASEHANDAIVIGASPVENTYFRLLKLDIGQMEEFKIEEFETVVVALSGTADITVSGQRFESVGQRADIWSGQADSVYCGRNKVVHIVALTLVELAVAGGRSEADYAAFHVRPDEVDCVDVGSNETKSRRKIFHILGHNGAGRCGNLLVSELYCDEGCWSGYPPHKHDTDREGETAHEEIYHYRFNPPSGFGGQFWYEKSTQDRPVNPRVTMIRHGDTFCFDTGYHPTVTSPGHAEYIFTILVGKTQRSLIQHFDEEHRHLLDKIPGIAAMREKFK
jgi:5-deoxy-glucuronate isomerase